MTDLISQREMELLLRMAVLRRGAGDDHFDRCEADDWARLAVQHWTPGELPTRTALFSCWYANP